MRPSHTAEVRANINFEQALLAIEYIIDNSENDVWSMWESNKMKALAQKIEQKVSSSLEEKGIKMT